MTGAQPAVDWLPMESHDRRANLGLFAAAGAGWLVVGVIVLTQDPIASPAWGWIGALAIGTALAATTTPLYWLARFAGRRIAYHGDWVRAARRGAWTGMLAAAFVGLRLLGLFEPPIALFLVAIILVVEVTLSTER